MARTVFLGSCGLIFEQSQCKKDKTWKASKFTVRAEDTGKEKKAKWGIDGGKTA